MPPPPHIQKIILQTFLENVQKSFTKAQNLQYKFLDWKWPQPPLWHFSENSSVLVPSPVPNVDYDDDTDNDDLDLTGELGVKVARVSVRHDLNKYIDKIVQVNFSNEVWYTG